MPIGPGIIHSVNIITQPNTDALPAFVINQEQCNSCSACVRLLGCPAILVADERYVIDQGMCDGCGLCVRACRHDAIEQVCPETV